MAIIRHMVQRAIVETLKRRNNKCKVFRSSIPATNIFMIEYELDFRILLWKSSRPRGAIEERLQSGPTSGH
jgi:hypothetical protein